MPGEKLLFTGAAGTGKSTLVRALAGAWPWGRGRIEIRAGARLLVLPQSAYLPAGSLRRVVSYPDAADNRSAGEIAAALHKVDLSHLAAHLDEDAPWDRILSGGEKQRLAFARVFLLRPDIVVLDEATAALDLPSQDQYSASPRKGVMYVCDNEVGRAAQMRLSLRLKSCKDRNETSSLSEDAQQNSRSATWRTPSCQTRRTCRRH